MCRYQIVTSRRAVPYIFVMPKLWTETIETHRRQVRGATLDAAAALVAKRGLLAVTMSEIAEGTGIGRATLYKYFPDVEAILLAWHERHVTRHLEHLAEVRDRSGDAGERLEAVLEAYALISQERSQEHYGGEIAALVHTGKHVARAQRRLNDFIGDVLIDAAKTGNVRKDVPLDELASYCLHALAAASYVRSKAAIRRLVEVTLAGLRPHAGSLRSPKGPVGNEGRRK
jgi:AcrR family transcriptional regulator